MVNQIENAADLIRGLDADAIAAKIAEMERETKALRLLLRSARARQNASKRHCGDHATEVRNHHG
jgi:hypothetical protein